MWQTIDTVPRDDTMVLLCCSEEVAACYRLASRIAVGCYRVSLGQEVFYLASSPCVLPGYTFTHWQPLPPFPEDVQNTLSAN